LPQSILEQTKAWTIVVMVDVEADLWIAQVGNKRNMLG